MNKHLITIEGTDGSGKQTQSELLYQKLSQLGYSCKLINFPDYESQSSALVKMYLAGDFGTAIEVNGYAASMLYAADRFASYRCKWKKDYENGTIIIADRYVSSNLIHQAIRMESSSQKDDFIKWLYDIEYSKFGIPRPSLELFLDMPPKNSLELTADRVNKITGKEEKDILESDTEHVEKAYSNAKDLSDKLGWEKIECVEENKIRSIDDIHNSVLKIVLEYIDEKCK